VLSLLVALLPTTCSIMIFFFSFFFFARKALWTPSVLFLRDLPKRHMLSVYFSASLAFPLIIVLA
jgi:hypothetical protein